MSNDVNKLQKTSHKAMKDSTHRVLEAVHVGRQNGIANVRRLSDSLQNFSVVGHLRTYGGKEYQLGPIKLNLMGEQRQPFPSHVQ